MNSAQYKRSKWPWFMLGMLFIAYNLSVTDRSIIVLMIEPMKAHFQATDTQISYLHGFAFLVIYSLVGLPMGLLADRLSRKHLVGGGIAIWSLMTALCGVTNSYSQLFAARVGVGIGEAVLSPAAHSLIANSFSRKHLGLAVGVFSMGGITGVAVAMIGGGQLLAALTVNAPIILPWIGQVEPWQAAFILLGLPGLAIAPLFLLLREPPREAADTGRPSGLPKAELVTFYRLHWRALLPHHLAIGCTHLMMLGSITWITPYFMRVHSWPVDRIGLWIGVANIAAGLAGFLFGGALSDRLGRKGVRGRLHLCVAAMPIGALSAGLFTLTDSPAVAIAGFTLFLACVLLPYGVASAALQDIAPEGARATLAAIFLLVVSLVSSSGPTFVAILSDFQFTAQEGVRYSLLTVALIGTTLAGLLFLLSVRPFEHASKASIRTLGESSSTQNFSELKAASN